uniref:NADH-ubiquinone oxidoreductase chain 4L n=1 Tax=Brentidae sp. GENSP01 TaxID=1205806 RepID=A0A0S2MQQ3_9CUCU|nr:NADH deshydrogenase subunit 4L [Brentidae sp. GENSP01]
MSMYLYSFSLMFFSGLMIYVLKYNHLLVMLLSLEFMMLSLYLIMYFYFSFLTFEYFFSMVYLTMSVCEGALGLSVLVLMIRTYGNDHIISLNMLC